MSGSKPQYSVLERNRGVLAAVAGTAITTPGEITKRFVAAMKQ